MGIEAELKFTCTREISDDELFLHPLIATFRGEMMKTEMHTIYLDTEERDTRANGISIRIRTENGISQLTLKEKQECEGGLSVRGEWSVCTENAERAYELLEKEGAPVSAIFGKKLIPVAEVLFSRVSATVEPRLGFSFELSLDRGVFKTSGTRFFEIEMELVSGDICELKEYGAALADALGLVPEHRSKHARALMKA